jgi:hypothetical protein
MKALKILLLLHLLVSSAWAGEATSNVVSGRFCNMPVSEILRLHERLSGAAIAVPAEFKNQRTGLTFTIDKKTTEEALRIIERALSTQAGVEIVRARDGTLCVRKIVASK